MSFGVGGTNVEVSPWKLPHPWGPVGWPNSQGAEVSPNM
jgi:hypothetical protein